MSDPTNLCAQDSRELRELIGLFDAPAYVRRARQVEAAHDQLVERCRRQRDEWLTMVRVRLRQFVARAGGWAGARSWMADDAMLEVLIRLHGALRPAVRVAPPRTESMRVLRRAAVALQESIARFNKRWEAYLGCLDLQPVNVLREGYNRHYLLEKECALRSARLAREGFRPLKPLTADEIAAVLPPLPVLDLAGVRP
jgi:hypothetical protein